MADWESTRQQCLADLTAIASVLQGANTLQGKVSQIPQKVREQLADVGRQASHQHKRLTKNEFEVAVIGSEKAGKSTFLNGWLGSKVLPSANARCTYTTTEMRSSSSSDQRYEVEYFSRLEFDQGKATLEAEFKKYIDDPDLTRGTDYARLDGELKDIQKYQSDIMGWLDRGIESRAFNDFADVKDDLKDMIANPQRARAVKKVVIYTPQLSNKQNIVFYDVPGFDSPIKLHKQQAEDKLGEVDAILYAKKFEQPSLTGPELDVLKHNDKVDKYIKIGQKCFVALTNCDASADKKGYDSVLQDNYSAWNAETGGLIPKERIIPVCAPLLIHDFWDDPDTTDRVRQKLIMLNGGDTGVQKLKDAVEVYIDTQRSVVVKTRCDNIVQEARSVANEILAKTLEHYSGDVDKIQNEASRIADEKFAEWWKPKWVEITREYLRYEHEKIRPKPDPDAPADKHQKSSEFRKRYEELIEKIMNDVKASKEDEQTLIYREQSGNRDIIDPQQGHRAIRSELAEQTMNKLQELAEKLAEVIWAIITDILKNTTRVMWGINGIRETLFPKKTDSDCIDELRQSLEALILRLARPAVDLFLRYPRDTRDRAINELWIDLMIIDIFYQADDTNDKLNVRGLPSFLANGQFQVISDILQYKNDIKSLEYSDPLKNLTEIKEQVRLDIEEFVSYMKDSIYYGAGLEQFCDQELDKLERRFREAEENYGRWDTLVRGAVREGKVPGAPNMLSEIENHKAIAKAIQQLQSTLLGGNMNSSNSGSPF